MPSDALDSFAGPFPGQSTTRSNRSSLPARDQLLAEIAAEEGRIEAIKHIAEKYGVAECTVRRHIRGVQGQGSSNVPNGRTTVQDVYSETIDGHSRNTVGNTHAEPLESIGSCSDADLDDTPLEAVPELTEEELEQADAHFTAGKWIDGDRYVYNADLDTYNFFLRSTTKKQVLTGRTIRAMKRAYSNMGEGATINEVARSFQIRRDIFTEIKQVLGWTHDSDAFTDEEHLTRETTTLLQDAVQMSRSKLDQEFNRKSWHETQRDAERYRQLDHFIVQPILDRIDTNATRFTPAPLVMSKSRTRFAALTSSGELHYNKSGWIGETGETFNCQIADDRFAATTSAMLSAIQVHGRPEKLIYIVGNDDLTIDGLRHETTAGTPQDVNGTGRQMLEEFYEIQVREIQRLRSVAPVEIILSAGNHNTFLSYVVMKMLAIQFRDSRHVDVKLTARMRSYTHYGNTLIGATHGHQVKPAKLMNVMGIEASQMWSLCKYKAWFTGHYHSMETENLVGGRRYQMPSLSGLDRYHVEQGYLGIAGLSGYILDFEHGVTSTILCPAVDGIPESDGIPFSKYGSLSPAA